MASHLPLLQMTFLADHSSAPVLLPRISSADVSTVHSLCNLLKEKQFLTDFRKTTCVCVGSAFTELEISSKILCNELQKRAKAVFFN